jgi:branched-chain amino acid transport system permease protein
MFDSILFQVFINALIVGSVYALVAVGFVLTYTTTKFLNFAHGATVALSAYVFLVSFDSAGWLGAFILAVLSAMFFNYLVYTFVYKKLMYRKASKVILLLISFAILMGVEAIIQIVFTASPRRIALPIKEGLDFLGAKITPVQILIIVTTIVILIAVWLIIRRTKAGLGLRSISDNKELAEIYGLNSEKIIMNSFLIAGFLGAIAGAIISLEYVITPTIGTFYMIKGFVGAVTGGLTSLYGSIFGSYLVGIFENYGAWYFASSYKDAIAFVLLFLMLLIRPQGLFGRKKSVRD